MNLDSLITVAGLFVAVYAIIPRVRLLEISLRFGTTGWIILSISLSFILYLQFYKTFLVLGLTPGLNLSRWSINTSNASFLIMLVTVIILYAYIKIKHLSRVNVIKLRDYAFELSREKRYSELFSLIEGNLAQVTKTYHDRFLTSRLKLYLEKCATSYPSITSLSDTELQELVDRLANPPSKINYRLWPTIDGYWKKLLIELSRILPSHEKEKTAAKEIIHEILINKNTVKAITEIKPYFALDILPIKFNESHYFIDTYLRYLAEDTKSIMYHEVRNNQNLTHQHCYSLPSKNKLLHFLFANCKVAESYAVYKPIGEFVIVYLDRLYSGSMPDPYNDPIGDFIQSGRWDSELFVGISFFDIMITSALYQNIQWHMWLYYYTHFVERIVRNIAPNEKLVNPHDEWPTRYHRALYEITSSLCKWITAVSDMDLSQDNIKLQTTSATHENGNIPKSSMLALGRIFQLIMLSDNILDTFKLYLADMMYREYFNLKSHSKTKPYANAFINAIRCGGFNTMAPNYKYAEYLLYAFEKFDRIPYSTDLTNELHEILRDNVTQAKE